MKNYSHDTESHLNPVNFDLSALSEVNTGKDSLADQTGDSIFRNIFRSLPLPAIITDMEHNRVVECSRYFESMTGLSRKEIIGRTSLDFSTWQDKSERERFLKMVAREGRVMNFEARLFSPSGHYETWLLSGQSVKLNDTDFILISFTSIEDRVRAEEEKNRLEEQLRRQQKLEAIGTLAGGVAHEINNPLNIIMNFAELILDDAAVSGDVEAIRSYAASIVSESERISGIVRNLLSFSKHDEEAPAAVGMERIIEDTAVLTRRILAKDDIALSLESEDGQPQVKCRRKQIMQVLMNLIINARDALNERYAGYHQNKFIEIRSGLYSDEYGRWLRTCVEDMGSGIKPEDAGQIFEPFFSTKPHGAGTGLGLSVSREIIEEHGGRLSFESEAGKFTRFYMDLPLD